MARLRLIGACSPAAGREELVLRWFNLLPAAQATEVLTAEGVPTRSPRPPWPPGHWAGRTACRTGFALA